MCIKLVIILNMTAQHIDLYILGKSINFNKIQLKFIYGFWALACI